MHGGTAKRGSESPRFKHGRWSEHLPERVMPRYAEAAADADLLALRDEVALTDIQIADVLDGMRTDDAPPLRALAAAFADLRASQANGDVRGVADGLDRIGALIEGGVGELVAWQQVNALVDHRSRLVEREAKRLGLLQQYITVEQMMTMVAALTSLVREHVHDQNTLAAISAGMRQLLEADARLARTV